MQKLLKTGQWNSFFQFRVLNFKQTQYMCRLLITSLYVTEALDLLSTKTRRLLTRCCQADLISWTQKLYVTHKQYLDIAHLHTSHYESGIVTQNLTGMEFFGSHKPLLAVIHRHCWGWESCMLAPVLTTWFGPWQWSCNLPVSSVFIVICRLASMFFDSHTFYF